MLLAPPSNNSSLLTHARLKLSFILLLSYFATGWLGLLVPFASEKVTLFWLPSGIAAAALYRWTPKLWPSVFAAAFLLDLATGTPPLVNLLLATQSALAPLIIGWRLPRAHCGLSSP